MGKGRNKQLVTKRLQRITKQVVKPKGNGKIGKITDSNRVISKDAKHLRDRSTIKRLKMYGDRPTRDKGGKILTQRFMSKTCKNPVTRIAPDKRWFGNTKVVSQKQLQLFRKEMNKATRDPYTIVLKHKKLPTALLETNVKQTNRFNLLTVESYESTFGSKQQRKKPKLLSNTYESLMKRVEIKSSEYDNSTDCQTLEKKIERSNAFIVGQGLDHTAPIFLSGQSTRIKSELYKVIDSSDVILQVLDARDPMGTRSPHIEKYLKKECKHKHLILILNKVDLVPTWCTQRWLKILSSEHPTIAFKASVTNSFGKGALISLLRQFRLLHKNRRTLSVGLIGYPNVGKSSVINTLVSKKSCNVAPIPGETKIWQYVSLFDKFYLIDCPGVVYPRPGDNDETKLLRSVVRIEMIDQPEEYVHCILSRVRKEYLQKTYELESWTDSDDFMRQLSKKRGKLLSGGEPDFHNIAVTILHDWQRGRLPWFVSPMFEDDFEFEKRLREEEAEITKEREKYNTIDIDYEPIKMNNKLKDMSDSGKDLLLAHDFTETDSNMKEYLKDNDKKNNKNDNKNDQDIDMDNDNKPQTAEEKKKFANIKVSNPLGLPDSDPLILQAKLRVWKEMKSTK